MDRKTQFAMVLDYLFGKGVSMALPLDQVTFSTSRKTGRTRSIFLNGRLFGTMRSDGGVALTCFAAQILLCESVFGENCLTVMNEVAEFIAAGGSVFCRHVLRCGANIRPGSEVAVLGEDGKVLAVGKARLSSRMIERFKVGVAVKVRTGLGPNGV